MNKVIAREYVEKNYIKGKDETPKYANMIQAFECDFGVVEIKKDGFGKDKIRFDFPVSRQLFEDIELLRELSFNLRHEKIKIINVEETK
jgi:hypothetical protein